MLKDLFLIGTGIIGGAAAMYLIARNSPEHFLKTRKFADTVYSWGMAKVATFKSKL